MRERVKRKREKVREKENRKTVQFVEPRRCCRSRRIRRTFPGRCTSRLLWTSRRIHHCLSSNPPDLLSNQLLLVVDAVTVTVTVTLTRQSSNLGFDLFETGMGLDVPAPLIDKVNDIADASLDGSMMSSCRQLQQY
ncbi:hypothetical protein QYF36_025311 [Acer negundo]|nr:hypothetical protein QYF36_025311 [Acer negundo]